MNFLHQQMTNLATLTRDCNRLTQLLGLIDTDIDYLRKMEVDIKTKVHWLPSDVYIQYIKPRQWALNTTYSPFLPNIKIQHCIDSKCTCVAQKEAKYKPLTRTQNFTNIIYKPFTTFSCPHNPQLQSSYQITVNQSCLTLTVQNLTVDKDKPC